MRAKRSVSNLHGIAQQDVLSCISKLDIYISSVGEARGIELQSHFLNNKKEDALHVLITCDNPVRDLVLEAIEQYEDQECLTIGIDISLIHRKTLAEIFSLILHNKKTISLYIFYSLAKYAPPPAETFPNERVESVGIPFSGWSTKPGLPVTAIVGLGYEKSKALGAIEYLESSSSLLLLPKSSEEQYRDDILNQNDTLLSFTPASLKIDYEVQKPVDTILLLDSLIAGYKNDTKLVLLPFGPKIFFACSLVAAIANPEVSVWHVSSVDHQNSLNQDRLIVDTFGFSCSISQERRD